MDKKQAILKSVLKLVNREGFYHLNMKNIAKEANVAAGTIYLYFKGKEDLINALYSMIVNEFNQHVLQGYEDEKPVKENFYDMLNNAIEFYLTQPDNFSFIEQYTYAPFLFKENQNDNFLLLSPIYKMMSVGKKEGVIRNIPDSILLSLIHGPMNTIIKLHLAHKTDLNKRGAKQKFFDAAWSAIAVV
ncbi:TetR/AcrR family transcriptional regulator [Taibaiella lutea]|uniref:TetR/AcrR family transcriptional regulator n=1 Tax=Taibaiella lutea TaxID=2608001 RepID=A0A5M6CHG2_9BACT|nr:TetR/AcrR family transcriptional regulator [Taibaiella lutea]KAA5534648.1 TetR/AcrR family transcriptional regulator [Taibaiella lutea]